MTKLNEKQKNVVDSICCLLVKQFGYFPFSTDNEMEIRAGFDSVLLPFKQSGQIKDGILTLSIQRCGITGKMELIFSD